MDMVNGETYTALCEAVRKKAGRIFGLAGNGRSEEAAEAAAELAQMVTTARHQFTMQRESRDTDRYDLAALHVDVTTPSNSETPFEGE